MDSLAFGTQVLVHLDLKGAPPRISYLEKLFPFLREIGITGILLEWEDTFPYTKDLMPLGGLSYGALASGSPYSIEDAKQILQIAADCGLTVIPLLQTFGHLEFVLKHEQWRCLREVEAYPSSMCPLKSGTMPLIRSLIKQIIAFHPDIQYIHIGADEVWHLGLCPECTRKAQSSKHGKASLFLDHVTSVAQYIKDNFPNLKIIMWDDMLRNIDITALQEYFIGNLVEPMVWHYNNKQTFTLGYALWEKYSNIFSYIWGASAFKGASGSCQIVPVNKHYVENHEAWLSELGAHGSKINSFRGIVLTGWSRYDHYATLCELLPTAVPSLALCLKTWQSGGYTQQIHDSVSKFLGYTEPPLYLQSPIRPYSIAHELSFPGWQILVGVEWFANVKAKYRNIVDSDQVQTWFNQWQILNNYTNPMQIESMLPVLTELLLEVTTLENFLKTNLDMFFFPSTAEEFLGTWLMPIKQEISQLKCDCETQISIGCRVREYRNCLKFLRAYVIGTSNPSDMLHCSVWIEQMSKCSANQKDVRNKYINELCRQIQSGKLEEPFTLPPPPFGDISTLTPHIAQTNSWSDMSTISTTTIEVAASGDSQADEPAKKSSDKFMNIYENKLNEQNDIIEDLKQKNYALSEELNDCSAQINTQNTETEMGINMLASEVEYLKNRLKELITMKRNLQDEHNTIVIEWQNTTHGLQAKLDEEQHKNNELSATIEELENKLKVFEECDLTTSVGENIQQNLLDLHQAEISALEDKHSETLKNLEEKHVEMLSNKDKETEEKIRDIKLSYDQKIAEIISDAERNYKLKNDEIVKLEKVVEEQCERSQMEHDTSCNNETLVEKVSFMQQCILKMERLLRKYESNYTKKIYALNKELQMKENTVQIQLTTQRAQLLAQANSEKHLEIEAIISQLECRYRTLLEEQQVQFQKMRQEDLDTIKQLTNKLEEKI